MNLSVSSAFDGGNIRLVAIEGNATRSAVLLEADVKNAKSVIIATDSDEASVLITLTVRQLTAL